VHLFQRGNRRKKVNANIVSLDDPELVEVIGEQLYQQLMEDIDVLDSLISEPNMENVKV